MGDFYRLTSEQQTGLLKKLAIKALVSWNLEKDAEVVLITHRENAVYKVMTPNGDYVLRVHRWGYHSDEALRSELLWMEALSQNGIETPELIKTRNGDSFCIVEVDEVPEPRQVDLSRWINGVPLSDLTDKNDELSMHRSIGELMARLHNHAVNWTEPENFTRHSWDGEGLLGDNPVWGKFWELGHFNKEQREKVHRVRKIAMGQLQDFGQGDDRYGLIHCDFLPQNLLKEGDIVRIIDFDDCGYGWHMFDIITNLFAYISNPDFTAIMNAFIDGYRCHRKLSDEQLKTFDLFLILRMMTSCGWVHTRSETETARQFGKLLADSLSAQIDEYLDAY